MRVLLLARADGGWRRDGIGEPYAEVILAGAQVTALAPPTPVGGGPGARAAVFTDAVTDFARALDRFGDFPGRPPADWTRPAARAGTSAWPGRRRGRRRIGARPGDGGTDPLLQHGTAPVPVASHGDDPAAVLLRHEQRY